MHLQKLKPISKLCSKNLQYTLIVVCVLAAGRVNDILYIVECTPTSTLESQSQESTNFSSGEKSQQNTVS